MADPKQATPQVPSIATEEAFTSIVADKQRKEYEERRAKLVAEHKLTKHLYWYGTMPDTSCRGNWLAPDNANSDELRNPRHWSGRCPIRQGLDIAGAFFPAFTQPPFKSDTGDVAKGPEMPGTYSQFDDKQVEKILNASYKTYFRPHDTDPKKGELLKEENIGYKADPADIGYKTDRSPKDVPLAHFVYMIKIGHKGQIPSMEEFFQMVSRGELKSLAGD